MAIWSRDQRVDDAAKRVDDPTILFEREGRRSAVMPRDVAPYPMPDLGWIEEATPMGVRKIERHAPARAKQLAETIPAHSAASCAAALAASAKIYRELRAALHDDSFERRERAEQVAMDHLLHISDALREG